MEEIRFSVITPVYVGTRERSDSLLRAIYSLDSQTIDHNLFEHIIINDGSTFPVAIPDFPWIKLLEQPHLERVLAYNRGMEEAKGEIFCFLDSDDEYEPDYLGKVETFFRNFPDYKMFNFGCSFHHKTGKVTERSSFKPKEEKIGHEIFGGGNIVNGTFVFHRSIYDDLGGFPKSDTMKDPREGFRDKWLKMTSPWDFSMYAQEEFPEIKPLFTVVHPDHPKRYPRELGNPWGNDHYLFYKYTRKYHSRPIDEYLYIVHPR